MTTLEIWRGEVTKYILKVTANGVARDLTGLGIECEVKALPGAADPAFVTLAVGSGITLATQAGSTLGWAYVTFSSVQTNAISAGLRYIDVCVVSGIARKYILKPTRIIVRDVVNQP